MNAKDWEQPFQFRAPGLSFVAGPASDRKIALLIGALVFFIIAMAVAFGYVALHARHDKQYVALAGKQRVQALYIVKSASEASKAKVDAFATLQDTRDQFEVALKKMNAGDPDTGLPPSPDDVAQELTAVNQAWSQLRGDIDIVLRSEGVIRMLSEFVRAINNVMPDLLKISDDVSEVMIAAGAKPRDVYIASRQLMLGQRIATNVNRVLQGGLDAASAADAFRRDTQQFEAVLRSMLQGDQDSGVSRISDPKARAKLEQIQALFETVRELLSRILEKSPELFKAQVAANNLFMNVEPLLEHTTKLENAFVDLEQRRGVTSLTGYAFGGAALILLLWLGYSVLRNTRERLEETSAVSERQQAAIDQLLNEIGTLGDGDLTVEAAVNHAITGSIAESINYAVRALRDLVTAINQTAVEVAAAAEESQATAIHLARASERQAGQITLVTNSIQNMASSIEGVSAHAAESSDVAQKSVALANHGAEAVRTTIDGMNTIREQIDDTAKRIKRLGESSQEIGDIIELINDIAEQTNILALNAAIQASASGQAEGFATVADEVQQLAERSSQATRRIEALVKGIQMDTNEAMASMEQSTTEVVNGTRLAEAAGTALLEIQEVSAHLAGLIRNISGAAQQQAAVASNVSKTMSTIKSLTSQNLAGAKQTAILTENLTVQAKELHTMVSGFKLPGAEPRWSDESPKAYEQRGSSAS